MSYKYTRISTNDSESITVLVDGEMYTATDTHPHFDDIVLAAQEGDPNILSLIDASSLVAEKFEPLSRRVSVAGGTLFFDNEPVHNALAEQVLRFYREGLDFQPLVNFFEKLAANPNEHSREQLYNWLDGRNFTLRPDGNIMAYKGVVDRDGEFFSISSGNAIVDGVRHNGQIPNSVGSVVEMPRSSVEFNPGVGCSTGLHAGTWNYANGFARGAVLKVAIDPADVVSVPTDCSAQKIRVCRYTVLETIEQEFNGLLDFDDEDYVDDLGDDWDLEPDDYDPNPYYTFHSGGAINSTWDRW